MFGLGRRAAGARLIEALHAALVEASREPDLYGESALPDTVEGRFESLTLHTLLVLRRLGQLPPPADDVAQDLVDAVFAHLEIALREMGVGDFGVPKRMKKLAGAFYDRTHRYAAALDARSADALAHELGDRLPLVPGAGAGLADFLLSAERSLASRDLDGLVDGLSHIRLRRWADTVEPAA